MIRFSLSADYTQEKSDVEYKIICFWLELPAKTVREHKKNFKSDKSVEKWQETKNKQVQRGYFQTPFKKEVLISGRHSEN